MTCLTNKFARFAVKFISSFSPMSLCTKRVRCPFPKIPKWTLQDKTWYAQAIASGWNAGYEKSVKPLVCCRDMWSSCLILQKPASCWAIAVTQSLRQILETMRMKRILWQCSIPTENNSTPNQTSLALSCLGGKDTTFWMIKVNSRASYLHVIFNDQINHCCPVIP